MKRKILQFILKRLKNSNYTSFKECYECAVKRGSPQLCEQCYWVRENYKPNRIIFMNQQEEMNKRFDEKFKWFFDNQTNESLKNTTTPYDIKSFLQSEINKAYEQGRNDLWETYSKEGGYLLGKKEALANRNKEIVEMIEENIKECENGNTRLDRMTLIYTLSLITKANKE